MARYLMRETLEELGLQHFDDAWAKLFADTVVTLEQTVTGAYRPTARFARFKNVPEWLQLFQLVAGIRLGSEVPELEGLRPGRLVEMRRVDASIEPLPPHWSCSRSWSARRVRSCAAACVESAKSCSTGRSRTMARRKTSTVDGLYSPFSMALMVWRLTPTSSANCSCVRPLAARTAATSAVISGVSRPTCQIYFTGRRLSSRFVVGVVPRTRTRPFYAA
jgi:hypothetical protein